MTISRDEWLNALADAGDPVVNDPDAITIGEFAEMLGLPLSTATHKIARLVSTGRATKTRTVRTNAYGRTLYYIGYRLITPDAPTS